MFVDGMYECVDNLMIKMVKVRGFYFMFSCLGFSLFLYFSVIISFLKIYW